MEKHPKSPSSERIITGVNTDASGTAFPVRVVIVDDHLVVRAGLRALLDATPDIAVVGEATNGVEALQLAEQEVPHVLILDMSLPGLSGVEVAKHLAAAGSPVRVLALSAYDDDQYVVGMLGIGVAGYLLKDDAAIDLVEAVRGAARGEGGWFSRRIMARITRQDRDEKWLDATKLDHLSHREHEILVLVAGGLSNEQIAASLCLSEGTIKNHVTAIYDKLNVHSRAEAVSWAWQHRLVNERHVDAR